VHCEEMLGVLSDFVDGELDPELCAEISKHMAECGNCQVVVDSLTKTIMLYRNLGHQPLPDDAKTRLYKVLQLPDRR
jgi:anti-sigma factor RsiW